MQNGQQQAMPQIWVTMSLWEGDLKGKAIQEGLAFIKNKILGSVLTELEQESGAEVALVSPEDSERRYPPKSCWSEISKIKGWYYSTLFILSQFELWIWIKLNSKTINTFLKQILALTPPTDLTNLTYQYVSSHSAFTITQLC